MRRVSQRYRFSTRLRERERRRKKVRNYVLALVVVMIFIPGYSKWADSERLDTAERFDKSKEYYHSERRSEKYASDIQESLPEASSRAMLGTSEVLSVEEKVSEPLPGIPKASAVSDPLYRYLPGGQPQVSDLKKLSLLEESDRYGLKSTSEVIYFTPEKRLQQSAEALLKKYRVPWGAIVALDPKTGKVLTLAGHSEKEPKGANVALRSSFPAASLFKIVTASAAVEKAGLSSESKIRYRGGRYTLNRYNYRPDKRRDRRVMKLGEALGKSCNPVFGRVALNDLSAPILEQYAESFGFNREIPFEAPLSKSVFSYPQNDYEVARTAAGFGDVFVSPLHAAMFAAAMANEGVMMRPFLVENVFSSSGAKTYESSPEELEQVVLATTAKEVLKMMHETTVGGTAKRHFGRKAGKSLRHIKVAGKTGTLSGKDPKGVYHWFIAAAPMDNPRIAIAALVIDSGGARVGASSLGRRFLEHFFSEDKGA